MVSERTALFPGDTPYVRRPVLGFADGAHYAVSALTSTLHIGAHADAPAHYQPGGQGIDQRPLERYLGPCQVISVRLGRNERITPAALAGTHVEAPRVLFKTGSFPNPERWCNDFVALSPELIDHLADGGVRLVGIDTPSVDLAEDKVLVSHQAVARRDLAILEGLALADVEPGHYLLCALPLRLEGADASPVRAVLWKP